MQTLLKKHFFGCMSDPYATTVESNLGKVEKSYENDKTALTNIVVFTRIVPKSIQEECLVDVLFFTVILLYGMYEKNLPWITVIIHLIASSCAGIMTTIYSNKISTTALMGSLVTIMVSASSALTAVVDSLFLAQFACIIADSETNEPTLFAYGAKKDKYVLLITAHAVSLVTGLYRVKRSGLEFGAPSIISNIGVSMSVALTYVIWSSNGVFKIHTLVAFIIFVCMTSVCDVIVSFGGMSIPKTFAKNLWWIFMLASGVQYISFVGALSLLFGDNQIVTSGLVHTYTGIHARVQAVVMLAVLAITNSQRSFYITNQFRVNSRLVSSRRTAAMNANTEIVSCIFVRSIELCENSFPIAAGVVLFFAKDLSAFSRFIFLLYTTLLSLRFQIQARASVWMVVVIICFLGIGIDISLIVWLYKH